MKTDLVTVAIPAYNHQDYVQETISSIIKQTHRNLELIILNDGSTDDTDAKIRELLPECEKRFIRVEYISKQNEGLGATWNRAIDWARADYLYTIASDDVAMPQAIEVLYEFMSKHKKYAIALGDNQIINEKSERCYWDVNRNSTTKDNAVYRTRKEFLQARRKDFDFNSKDYGSYKTLIKGNYVINGKLFRKQMLINVGKYKPGMKFEDWYINLQLSKFYKIKFIDTILFSYRWHNTNTIKNPVYVAGGGKAVLDYEKENHPRWFEKYGQGEKNFIKRVGIDIKYFLKKLRAGSTML